MKENKYLYADMLGVLKLMKPKKCNTFKYSLYTSPALITLRLRQLSQHGASLVTDTFPCITI